MAISLSAAKAVIRSAIDSYFGPIPGGLTAPQTASINTQRDNLAFVIATCAVYVQENAEVDPGIAGTVTSGAGAGGATETTAPGTLS